MMNFLDLSAASEEERRVIKEILSDTSVVNFAAESKALQQASSSATSTVPSNNRVNLTSNHISSANSNNHTPFLQINNSQPPQQQQQQQQQQIQPQPQTNNAINSLVPTTPTTPPTTITSASNNSYRTNNSINNQTASSTPSTFNNLPANNISNNNIDNHNASNATTNNNHRKNYHSASNKEAINTGLSSKNTNINNEYRNRLPNSNTTSWNSINNATQGNSGNTTSNNNIKTVNQTTYQLQQDGLQLQQQQQQPAPLTPSASATNLTGSQPVTVSAQMPPMAGDINSVMSMDMTSAAPPQGYIQPPHVATYPHVYGGAPIFQTPVPYQYLIYPYLSPYVMSNNVVQTRHQVQPLSNQPPSSTNSHSRSHSHHHSTHNHQMHHHQQQQHPPPHQQQHHPAPLHHKDTSVSGGAITNTSNTNNLNSRHNVHQQPSPRSDTSSRPTQSVGTDIQRIELSQNTKTTISEKELPETPNGSNHPKSNQSEIKFAQQSKSDKFRRGTHETNDSLKENDSKSDAAHNPTELLKSSHDSNATKPIDASKDTTMSKNGSNPGAENKNLVPTVQRDPESNHIDSNSAQNHKRNHQANPNQNVRSNNQVDARQNLVPNKASTEGHTTDEGFETQSSLDVSKQSHESSLPTSDQTKSSPEHSDKLLQEKPTHDAELNSNESNNQKNMSAWASASSKSWASLFKRDGSSLLATSMNGDIEVTNQSDLENSDGEGGKRATRNQNAVINITNMSKESRSQEATKRALDKMAPRLAQKISSINLKHALPYLKPKGFINKGNGCYLNATLQALIACPPFYNLMREIGEVRGSRRENSCTPILDGFAELFLNFPPLDTNKKNKQANPQDQKLQVNNLQGEAIEPRCIYNVLGQIKSECLKGAQEDAEEFLSSVLNGLHEEMISLSEFIQDPATQNGHTSDIEDQNEDVSNDDNLWREVGPKNRSLPIRTARVVNTPIQEIFGGSLFSIRTAGKDRCGHRSPFFDLQLDISGDHVKSVHDAIKSFTAPETIHDFYCSKTKQKLDAQRRTSLDQLPPILILHLKQFVYTQDHGLKKLMKKIDYPIDFELPEQCLHEKNSNDKNLKTSRSYKLLAVVYHDGKEAVKGHYLTDVYHIGSSQWLRCDDSNLKVISAPRPEPQDSSRTPYLLFYRRLNTLRAQTGNHDNKRKN